VGTSTPTLTPHLPLPLQKNFECCGALKLTYEPPNPGVRASLRYIIKLSLYIYRTRRLKQKRLYPVWCFSCSCSWNVGTLTKKNGLQKEIQPTYIRVAIGYCFFVVVRSCLGFIHGYARWVFKFLKHPQISQNSKEFLFPREILRNYF